MVKYLSYRLIIILINRGGDSSCARAADARPSPRRTRRRRPSPRRSNRLFRIFFCLKHFIVHLPTSMLTCRASSPTGTFPCWSIRCGISSASSSTTIRRLTGLTGSQSHNVITGSICKGPGRTDPARLRRRHRGPVPGLVPGPGRHRVQHELAPDLIFDRGARRVRLRYPGSAPTSRRHGRLPARRGAARSLRDSHRRRAPLPQPGHLPELGVPGGLRTGTAACAWAG